MHLCKLTTLGLIAMTSAASAGALDDALRATAPCQALPGFDRTDQLRLSSIDISLRREVITVRAEGDIACTASGSTFLRGNLSTRVRLNAVLDSDSCRTKKAEVALANLGGTAGPILAAQQDEAEALLSEGFRLFIERECRKSLGPFLDE